MRAFVASAKGAGDFAGFLASPKARAVAAVMPAPTLRTRILDLVAELSQFHGYRTVWIDLAGGLCHSEPDEELERSGFLYVLTAFHPSEDELVDAVSRLVTVETSGAAALTGWAASPTSAALAPA